MITDKIHGLLDHMEKVRHDDAGDAPWALLYSWVQQRHISFAEFSELIRIFKSMR